MFFIDLDFFLILGSTFANHDDANGHDANGNDDANGDDDANWNVFVNVKLIGYDNDNNSLLKSNAILVSN